VAKYLGAVVVLLLGAQLVRFERTNPPVNSDLPAPAGVHDLLRRACYDCHSNETRWPWYSGVFPLSWLIHRDVVQGRQRLNFSDWGDYAEDPGTKSHKLDEIAKAIDEQNMGPWYYRLLHPDARLDGPERAALIAWVQQEIRSDSPSH
jgi:hypothetical protein